MRSAATVDDRRYSPAELSAMRLDGDVFALGEALVPVDQPADAATRAASLRPVVRAGGLVLAGRTAAWVHGALDLLEPPYEVAVDATLRRTGQRRIPPLPEVRFGPGDVDILRGVRVTTPLRTAFDLLRRTTDDDLLSSLLAATGLPPERIPAALSRLPGSPGKRAAIVRARALLAGRVRRN